MGFPAKFMRAQLNFFKPFVANCSLATTRKAQDRLGKLMEAVHRKDVLIKDHDFAAFSGAWVLPRDVRRDGVILYLHGGGYTCGNLDYAKGFGSTLADECGVRVFCAAYRLAPEDPFPAALDDALEAYHYLQRKGFGAKKITLCGESAGGGLIYALCLRLKELGEMMPCGLIGISPWTDLTASGKSYVTNRETDPSMTEEVLRFYTQCYTADPANPLVSPLWGDLRGLPPSLLFAGGDELLLDDARLLHDKLRASGCRSRLIIAPERWHAYVLYHLNENASDFDDINQFLGMNMSAARKLRWMRLDNAAKIYPAARRRRWINFFRVSVTLTSAVDVAVLQTALDVTVRRFPSMAVRLQRGVFWYYLEQISKAPPVQAEQSYPLVHMPFRQVKRCAFRVVVYRDRIALEIFHALTDGTGAMTFLKSLTAEYLTQKYGVSIPPDDGVVARLEEPLEEELEDSFLKYSGTVNASRRESTAYHLTGTPEADGFLNLTALQLNAAEVLKRAHEKNISVTEYLAALMMQAILDLQAEAVPNRQRRKPVKVLLPVNLRKIFPSCTLRNFAQYVTPEVDPRLGTYSLDELCRIVHCRMLLDCTDKQMRARIAANVNGEKMLILKLMPLFVKNLALKAVFDTVGECKSCLSFSNLGVITLPEPMGRYVRRMDFIIGPQSRAPYNCGLLTYNGTLYINFIRNIKEPTLERHFYRVLQEQGLKVKAESNQRI